MKGAIARGKYVTVCTNALLLEKQIDRFKPNRYFNWSIHLDGDEEMHDHSVCQKGVYDRAVSALKLAKSKGFRVTINCTLFNDADPERVAKFFDEVATFGIEGITVSPGYAYERAPDQQHFLNRGKTKQLFRDIFERGKGGKAWPFFQSVLFLDFLAGNRTYECTPWGNPTRTVFGWQRPCYLLGEGYAKTFAELMETTDWDSYGVGKYEKCADCMVHCGFEATRRAKNPLPSHGRCSPSSLQGIVTRGPDGAGYPARRAATRRLRLRTARRAQARRNQRSRSRRRNHLSAAE